MPDHPHPGQHIPGVDRSINDMMNQVISPDDVFKGMNQHILIWEDESNPGVKGPAEATELNSEPAPPPQPQPHDPQIDQGSDQLRVAVAEPGAAAVLTGEAEAPVHAAYGDGETHVATADTDQGSHANTSSANTDDGAGSDAIDHHVDTTAAA